MANTPHSRRLAVRVRQRPPILIKFYVYGTEEHHARIKGNSYRGTQRLPDKTFENRPKLPDNPQPGRVFGRKGMGSGYP